MPHILVCQNSKGGCSKSTTTVNVGACLARQGHSTLIVDLDPQANASGCFSLPDGAPSVLEIFEGGHPELFQVSKNLQVLAAHRELITVGQRLADDRQMLFRLRDYLRGLSNVDIIVLDTAPTTTGTSLAAMVAATHLLPILATNYFVLSGTQELLGLYAQIRQTLNPDLQILGAVVGSHDRRSRLACELLEVYRRDFGKTLLEPVIPRSIRIEESQVTRQPVIDRFPHSEAAALYHSLAKAIYDRVSGKESQ